MPFPPLKPVIWPECPAGFDPDGLALVLFTLPAGTRRPDARLLARSVLRELTGRLLPGAPVELVEGPHGPQLSGTDIRISLSYAADKVLIGMSRGRALGVDIVSVDNFPEAGVLSGLYLPKAASHSILEAELRDENFALRWAQMEACCKALGLPLAEITREREQAYAGCGLLNCQQINGYRMAVAIIPQYATQD